MTGDLELYLRADCGRDGRVAGDCTCPAAMACHGARRRLEERGADLDALRAEFARTVAKLRRLPRGELMLISVGDDPAGLWLAAARLIQGTAP